MLVLTRKQGESIQIEGGITVKLISVHGGRVKIGIDAPDYVSITRSELAVTAEMVPVEEPPAELLDERRHGRLAARNSRSGGFSSAMIPR